MPSKKGQMTSAVMFPHPGHCGRVRSRDNTIRMTLISCQQWLKKDPEFSDPSHPKGSENTIQANICSHWRCRERKGHGSIFTNPVSVNSGRLQFCRWSVILEYEERTITWKLWCQGQTLDNLSLMCGERCYHLT